MKLTEFIDTYKAAIANRVVDTYPPIYQPAEHGQLPKLLRQPMGAQADAVAGAIVSLKQNRGTTIVGEMGTGKTFIGAAASYGAGFRRVLVLCPPHLVNKWKREIELTVPLARAYIVNSITDLQNLHTNPLIDGLPVYTIMSRERAKLSYRWKPAVNYRWIFLPGGRTLRDPEDKQPYRTPHCPSCGAAVIDKNDNPIPLKKLARKKHACDRCGEPLWQADCEGPKRYALSEYVKHHMPGFFDLLIGDEVHEFKAKNSAQGIAAGVLAEACGKSLSLTGTLLGGYASTIFHLLYRFSPAIRTEFEHDAEKSWVHVYGFEEHTIRTGDEEDEEDGRNSRRRSYKRVTKEKPGLNPSALFHIIGNTVFLRLSDVAAGLPDYEEQIMISPLDTEKETIDIGLGETEEFSQENAYAALTTILKDELRKALVSGSRRMLATYLQTLLAYPDGCTRGETVFDPQTGDPLAMVPPLNDKKLYPKEKQLVELVKQERAANRRVLVYATNTGTRDITGRWKNILEQQGFNTVVMKADRVPPNKREAWVADKVKRGAEVMICHPRLVQTGLDLIDFPTIVWAQTDYSVYVMRQASRRSWRIGQRHPVKVIFMSYQGTLQSEALKLVARKLQSSLAVEGDLPEEGLSAFGDDGDDMMMMLARQIVNADELQEEEFETVEELFAQARSAEADDEQLLVNADWKPAEPEIEIVTPEETAQPQPVIETATVDILPDGQVIAEIHQPPAPEPKKSAEQQSLLSWKEFLSQPAKKTKRKKKQETQSMSLFDFADALEQELAAA